MESNSILKETLFTEEELNDSKMRWTSLIGFFNSISNRNYDKIDQLSFMDFHKQSNEVLSIDEWINFLSDKRVASVLNRMMLLNARANVNKILSSDDRSIAMAQKLGPTITMLNKYFDEIVSNNQNIETYIYSSVPFTKEEERSKNAKTLLIRPKINPYNPANPGSNNNVYKGKV